MKHHSAMAMIEVIFAIVIIAISVMTIPSMMNIADNTSKGTMIDEDVLKRMTEEIIKVSKARWDQNYQDDANNSEAQFNVLQISNECWNDNGIWKRKNPDSAMMCEINTSLPSSIPSSGDLNLTKGIEQLNGKNYTMSVNNGTYTIPVAYQVGYADSTMALSGTTGTATWTLGSSSSMNAGFTTGPTHLKEVVVHTVDASRNIDMTLTFFKSNVGKF